MDRVAWSLLILGDLDPLPAAQPAEPVTSHRNGEEPVFGRRSAQQ